MQKKDIIQLRITVVLIIVFVIVFLAQIKKEKWSLMAFFKTDKTVTKASPTPPQEDVFTKLEEEIQEMDLARDPFFFTPEDHLEESPTKPSLHGIVWDEEQPTAIINNTIVKIGSVIVGHTVIEIKKESVILSDGTDFFEIRIRPPTTDAASDDTQLKIP